MNHLFSKLLTGVVVLVSSTCLYAQTGSVIGTISDAKNKETLIGVTVSVNDSVGTATNISGSYELKLKPGTYDVKYRFVGYETKIEKISIAEGETKTINMDMKELTTQLNEVVISAGKFEQKLSEITVSMEVIKPALVENKNTTNISQVVDQTPGVTVMDGQASIRGGSGYSYGAGSRVLILVDDIPMLTADANDTKWSSLPVENLEQIEVIKGASSALYGSSALNGAINIRTAYPKDEPVTKINAYSGIYSRFDRDSLNWWKNTNPTYHGGNFFHSRKIKNLDLVLGGNYFNDDNYKQGNAEQRARFNFNTRYRFAKIEGLSAGINGNINTTKGGLFIIWQDADSGALKPSGGATSNYITRRVNIDPYITYYSKSGDKLTLRTRYYRTENINDTRQGSLAELFYSDLQYQKRFKNKLNFVTGFTSTASKVASQLYGDRNGVNYAGYAQIDKKFFDRLNVSAGVRGEYFRIDNFETTANFGILHNVRFKTYSFGFQDSVESSKFAGFEKRNVFHTNLKKTTADTLYLMKNSKVKPVFRFGLNYELIKNITFLRASYGQGYRFPSIAEKYVRTQASGLEIFPNDSLQAENGWSAEFAIKQGFKVSEWKGYLDAAFFWSEYQNMMQFTFGFWPNPTATNPANTTAGFKSQNIGQARISGVDLTLVGKGKILGIETTILAGYTYMNPINMSFLDTSLYRKNPLLHNEDTTLNNNILKYRFKNLAKADVQFDYKKVSFGVSYRYNSSMQNIDPVFDAFIVGLKSYRARNNKGASVFDARISYKINDINKVAIIVSNVFNREYMMRPADIQAPRTVAIQYSITF